MGQKVSTHDEEWRGPTSQGQEDTDKERVLSWEVHIARGCLDSFNRMLSAHAIVLSLLVTVNLMGFLQPPRGWDADSGHMYGRDKAVTTFSVANSLSLYTATAGLVFYIYCSHAAIISLHSVPLPTKFDDALSRDLLHKLRSALRCVALPSVKRRCAYIFSIFACSLCFCMIAYISAGIASTSPHDRFVGVILPAIPGCICLLFLLHVAAAKLRLELDFNTRFETFWSTMAPHIKEPPGIPSLDEDTVQALDPLPDVLYWYYHHRFGPVQLWRRCVWPQMCGKNRNVI